MHPPLYYRRRIPFYYSKTEQEFSSDPYEKYDPMVIRQSALHLSDIWQTYFLDPLLQMVDTHYPLSTSPNILDLGCGVGRWIGDLALRYPDAHCWGLDFSYQMLKRAHEFWIEKQPVQIDLSNKGFLEPTVIQGHALTNLHFGLADAADIPMNDHSQDLVVSSFLLDRVDDPRAVLQEIKRVLRPGSRLILFSPLNFTKAHHWHSYHPSVELRAVFTDTGIKITSWHEDVIIKEPLDARGNCIEWKCLCIVAEG